MKKKNILLALVLLMIPALAGAQALKGSYFLDSSLNRHDMNPAFAPRAGYFQLFGIGNLGVGAMTNIDMPSLLYPLDNGSLGTFLHPDVSMAQFNKAFPKHPHLDAELSTTLLGFGFYTKNKSFWTFDLDVRTNLDVDLPGDMFRFIKAGTGTSGGSWNIGNMNAYMMAGVHASLGYSRDIIKGLRGGIKARVIAPAAYGAFNLENMRLTASEGKWTINTEGYVHTALAGLDLYQEQGELMPVAEFDQNKFIQNKALAGIGWSFDLGFEYTLELGTPVDGLSISASVTDLGCIHYKPAAVSSYKSEGSVEWSGFQDMTFDNISDMESVLNDFVEDAKNGLVNLSEIQGGRMTRSTMPRFHVGVELPFLKRSMSVGLLYSSRLSHSYARNELTLSYNLTPCKWFALGLNYSFLNTARTMGFILELTPRVGPAFYIGCDYIPASFAQADFVPVVGMLPMALRTNLNFGIAFQTGGKGTRKVKKIINEEEE